MENDSELILVTRSKEGDSKLVIYHLRTANQEISDDIVLVGDPGRTYEVAEFFDNGIESEIKNREFIILNGRYLGRRITAIGTGIGTDNQDIVIIEVHATTECDFQTRRWAEKPKKLRAIRVGTSGSPEAAPIGTLGISRYALGLDNTGTYYPYLSLDEFVEAIRLKFRRACRKSIAGIPLLEIYPNLKEYCLRKYGLDPTTWPEEKIKNRLFRFFQPYVAKMDTKTANALEQAASYLGFAHMSGISTSASGFYGPQGRVIGRAQPVLIPQLQDVLADFQVTDPNNQSKNLQVILMKWKPVSWLDSAMKYWVITSG